MVLQAHNPAMILMMPIVITTKAYKRDTMALIAVRCLSLVVITIGALSGTGFFLKRGVLASWANGETPMALPTAVCVVLIGINFLILSTRYGTPGLSKT